jgi:hypothetical protein
MLTSSSLACAGRSPDVAGAPVADARSSGDPDAGASDAGPDGGTGVACVDQPNDLPRPTTALPCALVPPP